MKSNINLVLGKAQPQKNPIAVKVSYYVFAGIFLVAIVVLAILFISKIQLNALSDQEQQTLASINQQADKKLKMIIVSERLSTIKNIFSQRGNLDQKLSSVISLVPEAITVDAVNAGDDKVTLSLKTDDLLALNTYLENDLPTALKKFAIPIKDVTVNNMSSNNNSYQASITFTFVSATGS
jgi:hypothetical protein